MLNKLSLYIHKYHTASLQPPPSPVSAQTATNKPALPLHSYSSTFFSFTHSLNLPIMPKRHSASSSSSRLSLRVSNNEARHRASGLFSRLHCNDLLNEMSPVIIPAGYSLQKACEILIKNNIECAPIASRNSPVSGLFTFSALSAYIVQQFARRQNVKMSRSGGISDFDLRRLVTHSFGPEKLASEFSNLEYYVSARPGDSVCSVAQMLRRGYSYVAVFYDHGPYAGIITPSILLRRLLYSVTDLARHFPGRISERFPECCNTSPTTIAQDVRVFNSGTHFRAFRSIFLYLIQ